MSNTADRVDLVVAVFVVRDLRAARDWCCDSAAFFLFYVVHTTHTKFIIIIIIKSNLRFFFRALVLALGCLCGAYCVIDGFKTDDLAFCASTNRLAFFLWLIAILWKCGRE